ncbi:MAG: tripartite tricarboxylate transporter substrate binding protein [Syntrophales bacterium]|nr:tripartite tricarboxylate transporter substrate binding protein [Syntrophales bacterium]
MKRSTRVILSFSVIVILGLITFSATAAEFPAKPVTVIVPWSPGGSTDICTRMLAETTSKYLGKPVVVENKPGGGGTLGPATMAATARPDGYTLSQIPMGVLRLPHIMKASWDPLKDFTYIIQVAGYTYGIVVKKDAPWKTFKELIAYAKANPGKVTYSTAGVGTMQHVVMEKIARKEGIKWIHVPAKGGTDVVTAVMGGHVMVGADPATWAPQVESGDLRLLVTWSSKRPPTWPKVPTLKELGYNIVAYSPFGIAGPKGMDPKVVKILHDAFKKGYDDPTFQKTLTKYYFAPLYLNSRDYTKNISELYKEERENARILGLKKN